MSSLTPALVIVYVAYSIFHFYMSWHVKNFRGANQGFEAFLIFFTFVGMLFQFGFLVWFGFRLSWGGAGILLLSSFAAFLVAMPIEVLASKLVHPGFPYLISLFGFIALPVLAVLMLLFV